MSAIIAIASGRKSKPITPKRPSWENMKKNYPNSSVPTKSLYVTIGGGLPEYLKTDPTYWENSCCIRMSRGLNYSGFSLPKAPSPGGTIYGNDQKKYWIRVKDLLPYLKKKFGKPDIECIGGHSAVSKFKGKKGIIVFEVSGWRNATGHFTLRDGQHLSYPGEPQHDDPNSELYYFHMRYSTIEGKIIKTTKVYLWELK